MAIPTDAELIIMEFYHNKKTISLSTLSISKDTLKIPGFDYCPTITFDKSDSSLSMPGYDSERVRLDFNMSENR